LQMKNADVRKEIGCLIKIGALVERLIQCGNCKHFAPTDLMCANPAHELPEYVEITERCGNWELNERPAEPNRFKLKTKEKVFVEHIQGHLTNDLQVCCKICDQTIDEIYRQYLGGYNGEK